jgi:hypothetical protein
VNERCGMHTLFYVCWSPMAADLACFLGKEQETPSAPSLLKHLSHKFECKGVGADLL